jgi:2-oxoglutarate ferredoxin oxidoreductase subunit beta
MTTEQATPEIEELDRKDFQTDQDVRWCPGCGDYAILATLQKVFPELGIPQEDFAIVSGIGCSSRFPFYMNTYGFHTIHGRAPAIATGLRASNPDLSVWVVTGDGDALSIGGNHLMHAIRRNVDLKILLFNNRIYGLTKGQYSPTSEQGKHTKSTPFGSIDAPVDPVSFVLGANATFVARTIDREPRHMADIFKRAADHKGTAFIEIFQNCNIFNDGAFAHLTDRKSKKDQQIHLEDGEKIIFGKEDEKCIIRSDWGLKVALVEDVDESDIVVHREDAPVEYHLMLSRLRREYGTPIGVLRSVDEPTYDNLLHQQLASAVDQKGRGNLQDLITGNNTWSVGE